MLSLSQRNYDAWVTREPRWYNDDVVTPPHCTNCGAFLKMGAERSEPWEATDTCTGHSETFGDGMEYPPVCGISAKHEPHEVVVAAGVTEYRTCKKCGITNTWTEA